MRQGASLAPRNDEGCPAAIAGHHRAWLLQLIGEKDFTLRGLVVELAERGLKVDYRSVWSFVHAERLSFKKKAGERDRPDIARRRAQWTKYQGRGSSLSAWSLSTRPGPRRTWRHCGAGRRAARGSPPRSRMAAERRQHLGQRSDTIGSRLHGFSKAQSTARPSQLFRPETPVSLPKPRKCRAFSHTGKCWSTSVVVQRPGPPAMRNALLAR
jgi:hypothetical protein